MIVSVLCSLASCFFGYRLQRLFITVSGLLTGASLGGCGAALLLPQSDFFLALVITSAVVVGIIAAALAFFFYKVGLFIFAFTQVFSLVYNGTNTLVFNRNLTFDSFSLMIESSLQGDFSGVNYMVLIPALLLGLLAAVITVIFTRDIMILITALSGGFHASFVIFQSLIKFDNMAIIVLAGAALTALGAFVQFKTTKKYTRRHR